MELPVWLQVFLAWIILGSILNLVAFRKYYGRFVKEVDRDYNQGYKDAEINMRMFYAVVGQFPSTIWVRRSREYEGSLDTRIKLLAFGVDELKTENK